MNNLISLVNTLRENFTEDEQSSLGERSGLILASAIAISLPIPAESGGASGSNYYNDHYLTKVRELVAQINELHLLEVTPVLSLINKLYAARFNFVHKPQMTINETNAILTSYLADDVVQGLKAISISELNQMYTSVADYFNPTTQSNSDA
jgi:hypothetical protein